MYFKKESFNDDLEILVTEQNLVTFTATIVAEGVTADENGKKYVKSGSLIDANGKVVTQTGESGSEVLSATPVGILYQTVEVTNGDEVGALVVEGYLRADRVLDGFVDKTKANIKTALPEVKFR